MIRKANMSDVNILAELALLLWPENTAVDLAEEFHENITQNDTAFFLAYEMSQPVGFAQCQLRHDYVEGTNSSPVGYLEGIFVREEYRRRGFARCLLTACEKWTLEQGCREFASDCELENSASLKFHLNMDFEESNRIICFTKKL